MAASDSVSAPVLPAPQYGSKGFAEWYGWSSAWMLWKQTNTMLEAQAAIVKKWEAAYYQAIGGSTV